MPSRYYFLASLPMLRFQDHAPISWENFLAEAKGNISDADYALLCALNGGSDCGNAFLKSWNSMNRGLDGSVNDQRKAALGRDESSGIAFRDLDVEQAGSAAFSAKNPLEAELILMKFRYDWLDREKGFEPFSEKALLAYALQLRILLRKDLFTVESGNQEFTKVFDKVQNEIITD